MTSTEKSNNDTNISSDYQYVYQEHGNVEPHDFANVEDMLFEVFRCEETDSIDSISIAQFLKALEQTGLRKSDPRLKEMVKRLEGKMPKKEIGRKEFKELIYENI